MGKRVGLKPRFLAIARNDTWALDAAAGPWIGLFLILLGAYVLVRFAFLGGRIQVREGALRRPLLARLGLVAGFFDAVGGGGWGPISTPTLLASRRMEPRKVGGTVDTSEFLV